MDYIKILIIIIFSIAFSCTADISKSKGDLVEKCDCDNFEKWVSYQEEIKENILKTKKGVDFETNLKTSVEKVLDVELKSIVSNIGKEINYNRIERQIDNSYDNSEKVIVRFIIMRSVVCFKYDLLCSDSSKTNNEIHELMDQELNQLINFVFKDEPVSNLDEKKPINSKNKEVRVDFTGNLFFKDNESPLIKGMLFYEGNLVGVTDSIGQYSFHILFLENKIPRQVKIILKIPDTNTTKTIFLHNSGNHQEIEI